MKNSIITIVDNHKLFREGVEIILKQFDFVEKVYQASNGKEYLDMLDVVAPDVALMDINMPIIDGVKATIESKKRVGTKIIALTMHDNITYYNKMVEAGVDGFITKETDAEELETAIKKVINGEHYFSQEILKSVIENLNFQTKNTVQDISFSDREKEILKQMTKGLSNQEIADELFISSRTVERHKENMYLKTNSKNGVSLIAFAIKQNVIKV